MRFSPRGPFGLNVWSGTWIRDEDNSHSVMVEIPNRKLNQL